jgi:hypothetical protein
VIEVQSTAGWVSGTESECGSGEPLAIVTTRPRSDTSA